MTVIECYLVSYVGLGTVKLYQYGIGEKKSGTTIILKKKKKVHKQDPKKTFLFRWHIFMLSGSRDSTKKNYLVVSA